MITNTQVNQLNKSIAYLDFIDLPPLQVVSISDSTLRIWHHMYAWIEKYEYADTADSPEFIEYVKSFRGVGVATIAAHLSKMAGVGLLKRNVLKRRLTPETKEILLNPVLNMFSGASLPTTLVRYTLPGVDCPLQFKSATRKTETILGNFAAAIKESSTVHH